MDKWKLGEGESEEELFGEDKYSKKGFSIGNLDKDLSDIIFEGKKPEKTDKTNKADKKNLQRNKIEVNGVRNDKNSLPIKILYLVLAIAAIFSAYYLYKTIFPGNNTNIKLFNLKTEVYKSKVLPENNLLITGYLINKNKFPVSFVRLKCQIYSVKNIVILTKHVYAGNFINAKKLKNMSNVAINMALNNRDGNNMSDVEILPNHPIKFMAVFFDISPNVKKYSISVSHFYRIKQ